MGNYGTKRLNFYRKIKRNKDGTLRLRLSVEERQTLQDLPKQLKELLNSDDESLKRLFPPAYQDDIAQEIEYQQLMREDLLASHLQNLEILEQTIDAESITEEQAFVWLKALNEIRLVIGTRLDITEDSLDELQNLPSTDPSLMGLAIYNYLSWLQEQIVIALEAN